MPLPDLYLDPTFALQSRLGGYYSADWRQTWALSARHLFQRTDLGPTFAEATAYSLFPRRRRPVTRPDRAKTPLIGAYSFPQFGAQQATITVRLPPQSLSAVLSFQPQDSERISDRTFTHSQPSFVYKWNVTSIFAAGFRYKTPTGPGRLMSPATKRSISRVIHRMTDELDPQRTLQKLLSS